MTIELRAATRQDVSELAAIFGQAFHDTPQWQWVIPNESARAKVLPAFFRPMLEHALKHGRLTVAEVDGKVRGAAAWLPSSKLEVPKWRGVRSFPTILAALKGKELKQFGERGPKLDAAARAAHPTMPHEYLAGVAVAPEAQGSGAGSGLIQHGLFAPTTYLECAQDLIPYYRRFGFEEHVRIDPGSEVPVQVGMLRQLAH